MKGSAFARPDRMYDRTFDALSDLLQPLSEIQQEQDFHPEGHALYHSLQVFERARSESKEPELLAAALFHDVGKGHARRDHALIGAELLSEWVRPRVSWLVEHHLDLLHAPKQCRWVLANNPLLNDLVQLRGWDLAGRATRAWVPTVERALGELLQPGLAEHWLSREAVRKDGF